MKKLILLIFIITLSLSIQPSFVLSETNGTGGNKEEIDLLNQRIKEKQDKVKQLEQSIAEYKKKIDEKRLEAVSLSNQMAILDNRAAQVELDIKATEEKLEALDLEIDALELIIEDKLKVISRQKTILSEFVREIHLNQDRSYLEIMAAYDNFSEFYNQLQYLENVERDMGKSVNGLKVAKAELEEKKGQKEDRKKSYEDLGEKLANQKKDLDEQVFLKSNLLAQTQSSELTYKTLVTSLKQQYQDIENEIEGIEREVRRRLEEEQLNQTPEDATGLLSWPTQSRYVTAYFHDPDYPYRHIFEHTGIDIRAAQGTPLKAVASGYVARAKHCSASSCYSYIMLVHSSGISTVYGHMSRITVAEDQFVTRGDIIGYSGGTPGTVGAGPFVTGPHLHFEVRKNGIPVNPLSYLIKDY